MRQRSILVGLCAAALWTLAFAGSAQADLYVVDNLGDAPDFSADDGSCDTDAGGDDTPCSLRAAIEEANLLPNVDVISFSAGGTGTISLLSELNAVQPVTIEGNGSGAGAGDTIIDGNVTFRLLLLNHSAGTVTLNDLRLQEGGIPNPPIADGGAAIRTDGDLALDNVTVAGNQITGTGAGSGAGILNIDPTANLTLTDSTISENTISSDGINAGAGISSAGPLTITDSTISGNDITGGIAALGGGIAVSGGYTVTGSTISGNTAVAGATGEGEGGGLYDGSTTGRSAISNSTISTNTAADSGAGMLSANDTSITGVTFIDNTIDSTVPVVGTDIRSTLGVATVKNSILGSAGSCLDDAGIGIGIGIVALSPGTNIEVGDTCNFSPAENQVDTPPMLSGLADNGGPTLTHAPLDGSPAIDMTSVGCGGLGFDQRGISRPQGTLCDIGAVEIQYRLLTATTTGTGSGAITSVPAGINCPAACVEDYLPGTSVTLTPTASGGSTFTGWGGSCDSTAGDQCTVALGSFAAGVDRMVSAGFALDSAPGAAAENTGTSTPPKKCKKGRKLKKGKCVKKKRKKR